MLFQYLLARESNCSFSGESGLACGYCGFLPGSAYGSLFSVTGTQWSLRRGLCNKQQVERRHEKKYFQLIPGAMIMDIPFQDGLWKPAGSLPFLIFFSFLIL